jgi:hypothetical protein
MNMNPRIFVIVSATLLLSVAGFALGGRGNVAQAQQTCIPVDSSGPEEVIPGVTLSWTSSYLCADAPNGDSYTFEVLVTNADSTEAVTIDDLTLRHTTPRRRGAGPDASAGASGLPVTIAPGTSATFTVSGDYELIQTDEGLKANVHLTASGEGAASGRQFNLGINAHFRAPGVAAD